MASVFPETKILKVTPGKVNKYVVDNTSFFNTLITLPTKEAKAAVSTISITDIVQSELTIHITQIRISRPCRKYLNLILKEPTYLKIGYNFHEFVHVITSPESIHSCEKFVFDFTAQYQMDIDQSFLASLDNNPVIFDLYAVNQSKEIVISNAALFIKNILDAVNRKVKATVLFENNDIDSTAPIGSVDFWYKFTCNKKDMKELCVGKDLCGFYRGRKESSSLSLIDALAKDNDEQLQKKDQMTVTDSEIDQFSDNLLLLLNRNKVLKTSQSTINNTLQDRVRWLRYEANWKQTLQEHAILHGKNPYEVNWRQWREEDTTAVRLRTYDKLTKEEYKPELSITIAKLYFLDNSAPLKNDEITQVYIEYSFLGQEGREVETPFSYPKGTMFQPTVFNWTKSFNIDIEKNYADCKTITTLIKNKDVLKFVVISEPEESLQRPFQTCEEVGYAEVHFEELIQLEDNIDIYQYEILDFHNPLIVVGYVTLRFEGILAMRKMALALMAPKGYGLLM